MSLRAPAPIGAEHDVATFDCGHAGLDRWLRGQGRAQGGARAGCLVTAGADGQVLGFYTLGAGSVRREDLPLGGGRNAPVPVLKLGRIAVDRSVQGRGIGAALVVDAIRRTHAVGLHAPVDALMTDAPDARAAAWFERLGFRPVPGRAGALVMPAGAIAALAGG